MTYSIDVPSGTLRYDSVGSGEAVVLIHGFSFDRSMWDPQVRGLGARHRVVRYDLRGFGESTAATGIRSHVADLLDLLDALEVRAAHLVGLSLGANVALATALAHPGRVRSLVLAAPGLPGHAWTSPRPPDEAAAYAREHGVEAGKRFWLAHPIFAPARRHPEVRARLERMVSAFPATQWLPDTPERPLPALAADLPQVTAPTLVLHGALDVPGYREIAEVLESGIPGARRTEFPDAGHLVNLEQHERFTDLVVEHLASASTSRLPSTAPSPS